MTKNEKPGSLAQSVLVLFVLLLLGACGAPTELDIPLTIVPTRTSTVQVIDPVPEPPPTKSLIVCLNAEPESLYIYSDAFLYGNTGYESNAVLNAIYDGPYDFIGYDLEPIILQRIPSLSEGEDVGFEVVSIREGEIYLNPETLQPEILRTGKPFLPVGCRRPSCIETYSGGEDFMERMWVDFHLKPGLTWSDGEPLTAADSVFSFNLDLHPDTPTIKYLIDRTHSYEIMDEDLSVRWTGIPGYIDQEYATNFWTPLPEHILGEYPPGELRSVEDANRSAIGWGPYRIVDWQAGEQIVLRKNSHYHRADEGLPRFDVLLFRFLGDDINAGIQQLLTGECDVLDRSLLPYAAYSSLVDLETEGHLKLVWGFTAELTRLDFNIDPVGDTFERGMFGDARLRRAIASCIDREGILEAVAFNRGALTNTYLSPVNPLYSENVQPVEYDVQAANELLEQIGWQDDDGDPGTPRVALGAAGVTFGTPLAISYLTSRGAVQELIAERLKTDLAQCGVSLSITFEGVDTIKVEWPTGTVFGRQFQTVGWSWPDWVTPLCEMFSAREIPSEENPFGSNASGFNHPDYNDACERILLGLPDDAWYVDAVIESQNIFATELPAIPLYIRPKMLATTENLCGVHIEPLSFSDLWNLEEYDVGEGCDG
jgi:peptide/nickel transport system substrate-binding protein